MAKLALEGWQKLLPNQPFNSDKYKGAGAVEERLYDTILRVCNFAPPQELFDIIPSNRHPIEEMASSPVVLGFLDWLIRLAGTKRVLEIGSFIGVSTMYFARALPDDGQVVSIEAFDEFADIAEQNFARNRLSDKITLVRGDAKDVLQNPAFGTKYGPFDMAFIDGDKGSYDRYFRAIEPMLSARGIAIIDDAFFHADVVNDPPVTEKGAGVRRALDHVQSLIGWRKTLLPISNGILLLYRE